MNEHTRLQQTAPIKHATSTSTGLYIGEGRTLALLFRCECGFVGTSNGDPVGDEIPRAAPSSPRTFKFCRDTKEGVIL